MPEMQVQIPEGVAPGGQMQVMTAQGAMMVQVPKDKKPGDTFTFMVPDAPAAPAAPVAQPLMPVGMQPVTGQPVAPVAPLPPVFFGRHSTNITCPTHGTPSHTITTAETGLGTWLVCGGLCLLGCNLGCCFIPFCINDAKDIKHTCANCGTFVGERKLIS